MSEQQSFDELIGENIARYRGDLPQKELADKMRDQGFKWSQATVWSTEKGDRPVRVTELLSLASILNKPYDAFFMAGGDSSLLQESESLVASHQAVRSYLKTSVRSWYVQKLALRHGYERLSDTDVSHLPEHALKEFRDNLALLKYYVTEETVNDIYAEITTEENLEMQRESHSKHVEPIQIIEVDSFDDEVSNGVDSEEG